MELETTAQPFGGRRWWFVCPKRGDLVSKLYRPSNGSLFASRQIYRLAYRSQRQSPHDRALSQAFKLRRRLGSKDGIGEFIEKPRGMRWRTYDRMMERIGAAETTINGHIRLVLQRLARRH